MTGTRGSWRARALALALTGSACADAPYEDRAAALSRCSSALRGGSPVEELLALRPEEQEAIVAVLAEPSIDGAATSCTGTLVSPELVLTAKHCAKDFAAGAEIEVRFGPEVRGASLREPVVDALLHEQLDLAVLRLAHAVDAGAAGIEPIAPHADSLHAALVALRVAIAGYGLDEELEDGTRGFAAAQVRALTDRHLEVQGAGMAGLCFGDSGGPLLARDVAGRARVIGVLSSGASACDGRDRFTRLDLARDWLLGLQLATDAAPLPGCGSTPRL